jgi:hypothetical protein
MGHELQKHLEPRTAHRKSRILFFLQGRKGEREFNPNFMKTKWGTCTAGTRRIWINLELAKKSPACLEYVVMHELVHLLVRHHADRFLAIMDKHLPRWRALREELNCLPLAHEAGENDALSGYTSSLLTSRFLQTGRACFLAGVLEVNENAIADLKHRSVPTLENLVILITDGDHIHQ